MPQLNGGGGDDLELGANDELIAFKDEGEQEEKRENVSAERDLDDVKSSLVNESENNSSSSDSEADRRPRPRPDLESYARQREFFAEAFRRQQDGGLFKPSPYAGYPFLMIPDLANLSNLGNPYLANGALSPGARTYLQMAQWPLLDVPGPASLKDHRSPTPTHLSNKVPVVQHPHMPHMPPLLSYSPDPFPPRTPPPHLSPDTAGISRTPHPAELSPYYPLSPGSMAQIPHHLGWLQGQSMYSLPGGGFRPSYPAALAMNASMSSLVSSRFSPHLVPPPQSSIPHPAIVTTAIKQEPRDCSQHGKSVSPSQKEKDEEKRPHIKKPLNAFMLYMKEQRAKVVSECTLKESAAINQILGRRWHSLTREEQAKYYDLARKERQLHSQLYPGWSARDNYGKRKKRKRDNKPESSQPEVLAEHFSPQTKKSCMPFGSQEKQQSASHTHTHLTHTHLSQASPASSLDSPATPTTALASPAAPAPTHTELTHSHPEHGEQIHPLSLTTKPHRPHRDAHTQPPSHPHTLLRTGKSSGPTASSSSTSSSPSSPPLSSSSYPVYSPPYVGSSSSKTPPLLSRPFPPYPPVLAPPPSTHHQSVLSSSQSALKTPEPQALSLVTRTNH